MELRLRNLLFYLFVMPATLLVSLLAVALFFLPYLWRYRLITAWSHFFIFWAKFTCGLQYQVEGLERLPKENAVVVANHQSTWETIFFQTILPPQCWVLKKELLYIPAFGWGLALLEPIAIQRKELNSIKAVLQKGLKRLQQGRWVIIFPEGTRVAVGETKKFSRTAAALAHAAQKPLVPIAHNAGEFWPRGFMIQKAGTIRVEIGPPIDPENKTTTELTQIAENWINQRRSSF